MTYRGRLQSRRLVSQDLLDGAGHQRAIRSQLTALIGVLGQQLSRPADQAGGRLGASDGDDIHEHQEFVAMQSPNCAGFVFELGLEKL